MCVSNVCERWGRSLPTSRSTRLAPSMGATIESSRSTRQKLLMRRCEVRRLRPHALRPQKVYSKVRVERDDSIVASIVRVRAAQASSGELAPIVRPHRSLHRSSNCSQCSLLHRALEFQFPYLEFEFPYLDFSQHAVVSEKPRFVHTKKRLLQGGAPCVQA